MSIIYSMNKIKNFFKSYALVITWTVCYAVMVWAVLRFLFNFDIFVLHNWVRLTGFHLHGFAGLVFGMFILAAVPLYFATTVVVARTKTAPVPFKIPLPRWLKAEPAPVTKEDVVVESRPEREEIVLPAGAPKEMREGFIRARRNASAHQYSVFNKPEVDKEVADTKAKNVVNDVESGTQNVQSDAISAQKRAVIAAAPKNNLRRRSQDLVHDTPNGLPLPDSFDIDSGAEVNFDAPVFSDINFDDDEDSGEKEVAEDKKSGAGDAPKKSNANKDFVKYLKKCGQKAKYQNGLYLSDKFVIALHDDDDLWIADDIDWFAAGKQKPSPITALKNAQTQYDVTPILFLDNANIMDGDTLIDTWRNDGIMVAQSTDELEEILKVAE